MSYLFPSQTITLDAALRDLARGSPKARAFAAHALGNVEDPAGRARAIEALIGALDDDRFEVRAEACSSLGELGSENPPGVLAALIKRLDDGAPPVRQNAAIALGTLAHADGFQALADALKSGPADLRFQAATSLAEIDTARAYDPCIAALGDKDPQVVGAAALSLGAIGDKRAVPILLEHLSDLDAGARFDVAYALAELGDASGRSHLTSALSDEHRAWDAATALAKLGTPDDVEALGRALVNKKTPLEATVLAAGRILAIAPASAHADAARRVLLAALTARKVHVRSLAVEQLGEVAGDWALIPLEKLSKSGKGEEILETIGDAREKIRARR